MGFIPAIVMVDIQLEDLRRRLAERKITIELTPQAKDRLAELGYDPVFGARPLKRTIQRLIENPLAVDVLADLVHAPLFDATELEKERKRRSGR